MRSQPLQRRHWIPFQTSLRSLLVFAIATGALAGMFGPDIVRAIRVRWSVPPPVPVLTVPPGARIDAEDESNGYFESAETPLR